MNKYILHFRIEKIHKMVVDAESPVKAFDDLRNNRSQIDPEKAYSTKFVPLNWELVSEDQNG
tara:strand:- start:528 stop:713 length:186 start_codon:yes stop_codon:yes gene_type:complete